MNVLQYLRVRAQKLGGFPVSKEDWEEVKKFEAEHPELTMQPSAISIDGREEGE